MQQILNNQKRYYKTSEVRVFRVPLWPELAIHKIWAEAIKNPRFLEYMPDSWTANAKTERSFFFAILGTVSPDYVQHLVLDCRQQRIQMKLNKPPPAQR